MENQKEVFGNHEFYRPLSLTGYLTPLQRKKLREKGNVQSNDLSIPRKSKEMKKPHVSKRKSVSFKSKERIKTSKSKIIKNDKKAQVQYPAANILKVSDINIKDRKFFKSASSNRLEKAKFCMPLVFKRNVFLNIDKSVKENLCWLTSRKGAVSKEQTDSLETFKVSEDVMSSNSAETFLMSVGKQTLDADNKVGHDSDVETSHNLSALNDKSVFDFEWPSDEFLLEIQEKARANMKKCKIIQESKFKVKCIQSEETTACKPMKLYPIFYVASKKQSKIHDDAKRIEKNALKWMKESRSGGEQMIIDAGQKEIGAKICKTCNMVYGSSLEDDEKLHSNYHNMYLISLKFPGWKEENVVGEYRDGRVIMIRKNDHHFKLKKIEDILEIANRDLGCSSQTTLSLKPDLTFVLFISNNKQVAGCMVAEPISAAYSVVADHNEFAPRDSLSDQEKSIWRSGAWYSSSEAVPAICGINRVWVAHDYRRCKVASRMMDCLRFHFIYGHVIGIRELAFTDPSLVGREFAAAYTGTDHFLVYR